MKLTGIGFGVLVVSIGCGSSSPATHAPTQSRLDCDAARAAASLAQAAYKQDQAAANLQQGTQLQKTYRSPKSGGFALFARSPGTATCHVAFKGTSPTDTNDLRADVTSIVRVDCTTSSGKRIGSCGKGFFRQYRGLREQGVVRDLDQAVRKGSCRGGVEIVGHSLGGALASIMAADLVTEWPTRYNRRSMRVATFGEPRSFSTADANRLHAAVNKTRWMNWGDTVSSVPPTVAGFRHFGVARLINSDRRKPASQRWSYAVRAQDESPTPINPLNHKLGAYMGRLQHCKSR